MNRTIHKKTILSSTRHLEEVRGFVATYAREARLSEKEVGQLQMAVDEACANIIEHAYGGEADHEIDVAVIVEPTRFVVRIRDEGAPFKTEAYTAPDIQQLVRHRRGGGLGVHLMRRLMDRVEYRTRGRTNEVHLIKYRNGKTAEGG